MYALSVLMGWNVTWSNENHSRDVCGTNIWQVGEYYPQLANARKQSIA
jgi:hypothetical protein